MVNPKMHYNRYEEMMSCTGRPARQNDSGYQAAIYILSSDDDLYAAARPFVSSDGLNFYRILSTANKHGYGDSQLLAIKAAHNLFNSGTTAVSIEQLAQCELPLLDVMVNAIYIQKGQRTPIPSKNGLMDLDCRKEHLTRMAYSQIFHQPPTT